MQNNLVLKVIPLLNTFTEEFAISLCNKGIYKRSLKEMENQEFKVDWDEERIYVSSEEFSVELNEEPKSFKCTCPSRSICKHVLMAYLYLSKNKVSIFGEVENSKVEIPLQIESQYVKRKEDNKKSKEVVNENSYNNTIKTLVIIRDMIFNLYNSGLGKCQSGILRELEQGAILCKGLSLSSIEKDIRVVINEVERYLEKSQSFDFHNYFEVITKLPLKINKLLTISEEEFFNSLKNKNDYNTSFNGELLSVGGEYFKTKSGFEGATVYFYSKESEKILTFTNVRPTIYESSGISEKLLWEMGAPWNIGGTIKGLSSHKIILKNGLISEDNRISTSKESSGELLSKLRGKDIIELVKFIDNFNNITFKFEEVTYNFLKASEYENLVHNRINGTLEISIKDKLNKKVILKIKKESHNQRSIEKLERIYNSNGLPLYVLCKTYVVEGDIILFPISFFDEGTTLKIWM
ncbi:MAG: hypothetical protein ACRC2K_08030 [Clostridium sp.]